MRICGFSFILSFELLEKAVEGFNTDKRLPIIRKSCEHQFFVNILM